MADVAVRAAQSVAARGDVGAHEHQVRDDEERARELRAALAEGVAAQRAQRDVLVAAAHGRGRDLAEQEPRADVRGPQADRQRGRRVEARPGADRRDGEDAAADHVARY